jgi:hypothetical protein
MEAGYIHMVNRFQTIFRQMIPSLLHHSGSRAQPIRVRGVMWRLPDKDKCQYALADHDTIMTGPLNHGLGWLASINYGETVARHGDRGG